MGMAFARVSSIASVVSLRAKDVFGAWRDLTESSLVADRDEILCEADGAQYGLEAYKLQGKAAGDWVDQATVTLHTPDGTSHYRQDRIAVNGDGSDSIVSVILTVQKGQLLLKDLLATLQRQARARFTLQDGVTKFRGLSDDIEHGNKAELGGFEQDFKGTVLCDRAQFTAATAPRRGWKLRWLPNQTTYRIEAVKEDEISYAIELASLSR